jgi:two-component system sensor histidine kinase DesK
MSDTINPKDSAANPMAPRQWQRRLGRARDLAASIAAFPPLQGPGEDERNRLHRTRWRRRFGGGLGLLWLISPISAFTESDPSGSRIALTAVGLTMFVGIYLLGVLDRRLGGRTVLLMLLAIASLLTLCAFHSFAILFVYVGAAAGVRLGFAGVPALAACTVLAYGLSAIAGSGQEESLSYAAVTLSIGFMMLAFGRLISVNHELEGAQEEIARLAVADERLRFARDLHDLLGHSLSVIALKSELAGRLLEREPAAAAVHIADVQEVARKALTEVRETVSGYRRPELSAELDGAHTALRAAGIELALDRTDVELTPDVEALLAWTVREGMTNVIRHSGATHCRVAIEPGLNSASVEVLDDGRGPGEPDPAGNGLAGLRERVERLAGALEAGRGPNGGFRLRVTVPTGELESAA